MVLILLLLLAFGQAFDFKGRSRFEEGLEPVLLDTDLAVVHEVEDGGQILAFGLPEDDDRVLARVLFQKSSIKRSENS